MLIRVTISLRFTLKSVDPNNNIGRAVDLDTLRERHNIDIPTSVVPIQTNGLNSILNDVPNSIYTRAQHTSKRR